MESAGATDRARWSPPLAPLNPAEVSTLRPSLSCCSCCFRTHPHPLRAFRVRPWRRPHRAASACAGDTGEYLWRCIYGPRLTLYALSFPRVPCNECRGLDRGRSKFFFAIPNWQLTFRCSCCARALCFCQGDVPASKAPKIASTSSTMYVSNLPSVPKTPLTTILDLPTDAFDSIAATYQVRACV